MIGPKTKPMPEKLASICRRHEIRPIPAPNRNGHQSWRETRFPTLTSTRTAPIDPGEAPNLRRRSLVGLRKDCVEATKAAETRAQRDLGH